MSSALTAGRAAPWGTWRGGSPEDQPHCLQRAACAMDRAREEFVSAGAGTKRQVRRGLRMLLSVSPSLVWGICGRSWMQNAMGVGKQQTLAEMGPWCRQACGGGDNCVV